MHNYDKWKLQTPEEANARFLLEDDLPQCGWCDEEITEGTCHEIFGEDVCIVCIDKTVKW